MHHVTLINGDGIGPEVCDAARRCVDATGARIFWDVQPAGAEVQAQLGTPLPDCTLDSIRKSRVALKGPITVSPSPSFRSVNMYLRQEFDLYALVRPCKFYHGARAATRETNVDVVIVRENTEDLYQGAEFEAGSPDTKWLIAAINERAKKKIRLDSAIGIKPISEFGSRRIVTFAFNYAQRLRRRKVTVVHKGNIMKLTDGLFLQVAREVARDFPSIDFEDRIVDNLCMQIVQKPEQYDVLVLPNLYGDIVSDLAAGLIGGLGMAPGGNVGERAAVFEATHGSSPKYKGQNKVNPTALILSAMLMLRHLGEMDAADRLERGVAAVLKEGKDVTYDLKPTRDDPTAVGTSQMVDAIIDQIRRN